MVGSKRNRRALGVTTVLVVSVSLALTACASDAKKPAGTPADAKIKVGLITKTETNPFFVKMKDGATKEAEKQGVELMTAAGKIDGDNESQVTAIENMV